MSKFAPIMETIVSTFETTVGKEKALQAKNVKEQNKVISLLVDAHIVANDKPTKAEYMKGNSATNEARKEIKTLFEGLATAGYIEKSTVKSYQNSFWIAFEQGLCLVFCAFLQWSSFPPCQLLWLILFLWLLLFCPQIFCLQGFY